MGLTLLEIQNKIYSSVTVGNLLFGIATLCIILFGAYMIDRFCR